MTTAQYRLKLIRSLPALLIIAALLIQLLPALQPAATQAAGAGYWSTSGIQIRDSNNQRVRITGVNWFGAETATYVPHGLWQRGYKSMMNQMKTLGYNSIRLPFSNQLLTNTSTSLADINFYADNGENEDLRNKTPLQVMDTIIAYAGQIGLRIILDRHRITVDKQDSLWYAASSDPSVNARTIACPTPPPENPTMLTPCYSEQGWIRDWKFLATRYQNNPTVIGADLHNEPHSDSTSNRDSCWGCGNLDFDWRLAAQRAGNAIHSVNPNWLIFVQGVGCWGKDASGNVIADVPTGSQAWPTLQCTWWGGNLRGVKDYPLSLTTPNKLVYSVHEYPKGVHPHGWFDASVFPTNLECLWEHYWAFIITGYQCDTADEAFGGSQTRTALSNFASIKAPVWVGEFGAKLEDTSDPEYTKDSQWFNTFTSYLKGAATFKDKVGADIPFKGVSSDRLDVGWSFWSWNPNSTDTGGLVGMDWSTVITAKHNPLAPMLFTLDPPGTPPTGPTATRTNTTQPAGPTATRTHTTTSGTSCPAGSGSILREYWNNVAGTGVGSIPLTGAPSGSGSLSLLEGPSNWGDSYGARIRGWVCPPASGSYTFWVAGDDDSELWLGTSDQASSKQRIAYVVGWTASREWSKYTTQRSAAISLVGGQRYYIEVLHKEGTGGDNIAVAWEGPGIAQQVIPGSALYPASGTTPPTATHTRTPTQGTNPTATLTRTPTQGSGGGGTCSPATAISAPFTFDGSGTRCWQIATIPSYINSWGLISLTINGANWTNLYATPGQLPAKINGYWYISYNSSNASGHFEVR